MSEICESDDKSSVSTVRVGEVRQLRRVIEEELVRMTDEFERATEVPTPGRPAVHELRARRAALLEELRRLRTGRATRRT